MNKTGKEPKDGSDITKGGALQNHDSINISEDKKPLIIEEPNNKKNSGETNGGSKKN